MIENSVHRVLGAEAPPLKEKLFFEAYDCSSPTEVDSIASDHMKQCAQPPEEVEQKNVTYMVLQKAKFRRAKAVLCNVKETQVTHYCGHYDHQTYAPRWSHYDIDKEVSRSECQDMWDEQQMRREDGQKIPLHRDSTTTFQYQSVGETTYGDDEIECVGSMIKGKDGNEYSELVQHRQYKVELREVDILIDKDDGILLNHNQVRIPCKFHQGTCRTSMGRINWSTHLGEEEQCRLYRTREIVTGVDVYDDRATVFMSTDDSRLRLQHGHKKIMCGETVITTNYKKIFLAESTAVGAPFNRELPTPEVSISTFAKIQDDFIYNRLSTTVRDEFVNVRVKICQQETKNFQKTLTRKLTRQAAALDGTVVPLGQGIFASAAGEAWYRYQCKQVIVKARNMDQCFSALPVELTSEQALVWWSNRGILPGNATASRDLFIEPVTRRLIRVGTPSPCIQEFPPLYQNLDGDWVKVTPTIEYAKAPEVVSADKALDISTPHLTRLINEAKQGFHNSGLYSGKKLEAWEQWQMMQNIANDIGTRLATEAGRLSGIPIPRQGIRAWFPEDNVVTLDPTKLGDNIFSEVKEYANYLLLIGIALLVFRFITWLVGIHQRVVHMRSQGRSDISTFRYALGAALPTMAHTLAPTLTEVRREIRAGRVDPSQQRVRTLIQPSQQAWVQQLDPELGIQMLPPPVTYPGQSPNREVEVSMMHLLRLVMEHQQAFQYLRGQGTNIPRTVYPDQTLQQQAHIENELRQPEVNAITAKRRPRPLPRIPTAPHQEEERPESTDGHYSFIQPRDQE